MDAVTGSEAPITRGAVCLLSADTSDAAGPRHCRASPSIISGFIRGLAGACGTAGGVA